MSSCGGDCFSCHSQNKLIKTKLKEHQDLASCKACHVNTEDILKFDNKFGPTLLEQYKYKFAKIGKNMDNYTFIKE